MNSNRPPDYLSKKHVRSLGEEHCLPREIYYSDGYFERSQLISLSEQIALIHELGPQSLLEVGHGNGFVSEFLKRSGIEVTTMDVNANLEPDIVASVTEMKRHFSEKQFDSVLCCEVLEHLSFDLFSGLIEAIASVARHSAVISLPTAKREVLKFGFTFRFHRNAEKFLGLRLKYRKKQIYAAHHWEIDHQEAFTLSKVLSILEENFGSVSYRVLEANPYHYFFICKHS